MPGVPHGRACDACRRQKKKRLGLKCIGSGERKFLFIDQKCRRRRADQQQADDLATGLTISRPASSSASFLTGATTISPPLPQTELQMLIGAFVYTIAPTTTRANLVQTYGPFLEMVPSRLGTNAALDNSTRAVVCAHQNVCRGRPATEEALAHYSLAIRTLSLCLNSFDSVRSTETVCAVIMLIMCEVLNGLSLRNWSSHADGATRILCVRLGSGRPLDEFGITLRSHLRGMMWFQGLWRRELRTDPARFESLVSGLYGGDAEEDEESIFMRRVQIPRLLARVGEARRSHIGSVESCMLRGLMKGQQPESPFEDTLSREAEDLADAALLLATEAAKGSNIGTGHVVINCFLAWICTGDAAKRARIRYVYDEFMRPISRTWVDGKVVSMWEVLASDLFLVADPLVAA
ncbi:hypothetical protein PG984_011720 [Apiospora sp. TS-2023a]